MAVFKRIALNLSASMAHALEARKKATGTTTQEFIRRCIVSGLRAEVKRPPRMFEEPAFVVDDLFAEQPELAALVGEEK